MFEYNFNFGKNLNSRNEYSLLKITSGRNYSAVGMLGQTLFNGINLASNILADFMI